MAVKLYAVRAVNIAREALVVWVLVHRAVGVEPVGACLIPLQSQAITLKKLHTKEVTRRKLHAGSHTQRQIACGLTLMSFHI